MVNSGLYLVVHIINEVKFLRRKTSAELKYQDKVPRRQSQKNQHEGSYLGMKKLNCLTKRGKCSREGEKEENVCSHRHRMGGRCKDWGGK